MKLKCILDFIVCFYQSRLFRYELLGFKNTFVCLFIQGTFKLTVEFTEEYPNRPPVVRFVSKMFHPNGKNIDF